MHPHLHALSLLITKNAEIVSLLKGLGIEFVSQPMRIENDDADEDVEYDEEEDREDDEDEDYLSYVIFEQQATKGTTCIELTMCIAREKADVKNPVVSISLHLTLKTADMVLIKLCFAVDELDRNRVTASLMRNITAQAEDDENLELFKDLFGVINLSKQQTVNMVKKIVRHYNALKA
jgi:hypothetical protein